MSLLPLAFAHACGKGGGSRGSCAVCIACFEAVELNLRRQLQIARLHWAALCAGTPQVTLAVMDPRLRSAGLRGDLAALNRALDEGADPNLADADGYNPLIFAVINNHTGCVARLIEAGARPNCQTNTSRTPLNSAASTGNAAIIRMLLAAGAQVNPVPGDEEIRELPPLYWAIDGSHAPAVRELLEAGADPNYEIMPGHPTVCITPLVRAVSYSQVVQRRPIAQLLLRAGASIHESIIDKNVDEMITPERAEQLLWLQAVHAGGGFPAYARGHRSMFAALFSRGNRLPADVIPKIVEYWAHLGYYQYRVPGTGSKSNV